MRCASERTSSATTAKPRPWSPARAASMAALRASRLVWSAMPLITSTTPPISLLSWARRLTAAPVSPTDSDRRWMALRVSAAMSRPREVSSLAFCVASAVNWTLFATSWVVAAISLTAVATCSVSARCCSRPAELWWARVSAWRACSVRYSAVSCRRVRQVFRRASWLRMAISRRAWSPRLSVYICAISGSEVVCSASRIRRFSPRFCQRSPARPSGTASRPARMKPHQEFSQIPMRKPIWLIRMNGSQSSSTGSQRSRRGSPACRRRGDGRGPRRAGSVRRSA